MPSGIIESNGVIQHISKPVPTLRVHRVGNDAIRLEESVDIRRIEPRLVIHDPAHDQTVADDYFAAMQRVEQRLEIVPTEQKDIEDVKVQEPEKLFQLIQRLELPELCLEERLGLAGRLREMLGKVNEHARLNTASRIII